MKSEPLTDAQYLLRKVLGEEGDEVAAKHRWISEFDRWTELIFALLTQVSSLPEREIREITLYMAGLQLLDISELATIPWENQRPSEYVAISRRIIEVLEEYGFSKNEAQRGLRAICEAAVGLHANYDDKIQKYMRYYGELMLNEIQKNFHFTALNEDEVGMAFTYWFQNVLNMPLSLVDNSVQNFCSQFKLQPKELIAAADSLDINVGLVDDLVQLYVAKRQEDRVLQQE